MVCCFSQGGEFKVSGISFQWNDGLFGMALAPTGDGYSTMYYHSLSSGMEFSVSTRLLRDAQRANAAGMFLDKTSRAYERGIMNRPILQIINSLFHMRLSYDSQKEAEIV